VENVFESRYQQKKITIYISSTMRDMRTERDELMLRVFPALREVCEERGIVLGMVDLRWGISEEKIEEEETLSICLKFIDECRPYFIGMLGERYGWVEETAPKGVIRDYPWIKDHPGKSINELEILHGVLNNPAMAIHALFYFRDKTYLESEKFRDAVKEEDRADFFETDSEASWKLAGLKERIRNSGFPVRENYSDPVAFGELVKEDLMRVIDSLALPKAPHTDNERASAALSREDMAHEAFAESRFGVYIPRQEYFAMLDAHVAGDGLPLVVLGESGSGKSALLAHWAFRYRLHHPDDLVIIHFVGASSESTDWAAMLRRFMGEFIRKFSIKSEIPGKDNALMAAFANRLSMVAAKGRVVLVIDALNHLEDRNGAPDLIWLPTKIPDNIRLIVSTLPGRSLNAIRKRGWPTMVVEPLTVSERNALITCFLRKYHKELSSSIKKELASVPQSQNPLFLRALLEEVRVHGVFEKLVDQIRKYLTAQTVDALYGMILARYELDYERDRLGLVKDTVSLLWSARRGLSKAELMDLLGRDGRPLPDAFWAPLYLAMEHSLIDKDGRINFYYDNIRIAVEHRYLSSEISKRTAHKKVADYFAKQSDELRRIDQLPWQLAEAAEWNLLVALLTEPSFFSAIWKEQKNDVKRYWAQTEAGSSYTIVDSYRPVIREPAHFSLSFVWELLSLLYQTGHLDEAIDLGDYIIRSSNKLGNTERLLESISIQAKIFYSRGDLKGAMQLYKEQERIYRELGNINELQHCLNNQLKIVEGRGDFEEAMALLKEQERIYRELEDIDGIQRSLNDQSKILKNRGDLDGAMALYKEQERICRELGNKDGLALSLGNQAIIIYTRGDLDGAMALYEEQERICRELENIDGLQRVLGGKATIIYTRGDLDGAMALYKEQERICRELGNINELQHSLNNQLKIVDDRGDFEEAMVLLKEQERIYRELDDIDRLQRSLNDQSKMLKNRGDLDGAMALYKEQERICRELGNKDGLALSLGNQAIIIYTRGDLDGAMALYEEQERIYRELGNVSGLQGVLGGKATILQARGDLDGARDLLREVEGICWKLGNIDRLLVSLGNQADIFYTRGDLDGAMALYKEQERICKNIRKIEGLQRSLGNQALIFKVKGNIEKSLTLYKQQEKLSREIGNVEGLQRSLYNQALILKVQGDIDGALLLLKEQEQICRELGNMDGLQAALDTQAILVKTPPDPSTLDADYIFISYKREDLPRIVSLMHRIVGWGYPIWYDRGIPGAAEWDKLIEEKVSHCKGLLVCLSKAAVESKWVRREIKFADRKNRPILGIRLDQDIEFKDGLDIIMSQYQMIDATDENFSDELQKAIEYVRLL
jgi:tetratricopeptide (TPR) repeat protein